MRTRRRVWHGSRRGGRGWEGHVRLLESVLEGTRRGRRAPGTVTLPLRAPPSGVVGAVRARHAQERGSRKGGRDGQRGLKTPSEWRTEAGAAAPAVVCAHTHGTRRTRARETPQGPQRARQRRRANRWLPACVRPRSARTSRVRAYARHPTKCSLCLRGLEADGVGPAHAGRHEARRIRAREGATRQVPPHVASHCRRPPVGPLRLLTQGGACRRTHVCEQRPPDGRVRGARA